MLHKIGKERQQWELPLGETGDVPFGEDGERRRRELEKEGDDRETIVSKIRAEIRRIEQRAKERRNP